MLHPCVVSCLPLLSVCPCCLHCREFGRWKVNSLALERQENNGFALPLDPEFLQTIRQLGRRPSLSTITDNIIRKYGTHFLLSATLGGKHCYLIPCLKSLTSRCPRKKEKKGLEAFSQNMQKHFNETVPDSFSDELNERHILLAEDFLCRETLCLHSPKNQFI